MFCDNCGCEIGGNYCSKCGTQATIQMPHILEYVEPLIWILFFLGLISTFNIFYNTDNFKFVLLTQPFVAGINLWTINMFKKGKNWMRILWTVISVISIVSSFKYAIEDFFVFLNIVVSLIILFILYTKSSSQYFR